MDRSKSVAKKTVTAKFPMTHAQSTRLLVVALTLVLCGTSLAAETDEPKPNIVIIVADDLGWKDVGYHGGSIATPNLDRLASEGVQLENWHVAPLCSPTRAGLMTGRWPIRYGMGESVITPWRKWGLPTTEHTIVDLLAAAGYERRGAVGKWHLGHYKKELLPLSRGFTFFYGHYNGAFDYFTHIRDGELDWHRNLETSHDEGYSTELIAREAADFITKSPTDKPVFSLRSFQRSAQSPPSQGGRYRKVCERPAGEASYLRCDGGLDGPSDR